MSNREFTGAGQADFDPKAFPNDFFQSRARFLTLTKNKGARLYSYPIDSRTANLQEPLSIDIALFGAPSAKKKVIHIAGTHGIEGYVGSAVQYTIVNNLDPATLSEQAVAFIHCLNPWGMVMKRRSNENNVDLNRNCIFDSRERNGAPAGYEIVRSLINPEVSSTFPAFTFRALLAVVQHGFTRVRQSITGGQYIDPEGIFYGGMELQPEICALQSWISDHISCNDHIVAIDLHSGLGSFCKDALLLDTMNGSEEHERILARFTGEIVHAPDSAKSLTYNTRGALRHLIHHCNPETKLEAVVHEFGTLHPFKVLHALVEENFQYFKKQSRIGRELLFEAFCPASLTWRRYAIQRGLEVFRKACCNPGNT